MTSPAQYQELLPTCQPQLGPPSLSQPNQHREMERVQSLPFSSPSQGQWDTCPLPCSQFSPSRFDLHDPPPTPIF